MTVSWYSTYIHEFLQPNYTSISNSSMCQPSFYKTKVKTPDSPSVAYALYHGDEPVSDPTSSLHFLVLLLGLTLTRSCISTSALSAPTIPPHSPFFPSGNWLEAPPTAISLMISCNQLGCPLIPAAIFNSLGITNCPPLQLKI